MSSAIWEELLGETPTSPDDDFYQMGGHSLLALKLLTRVRSEWGIAVSLREILESTRFSAQAGVIRKKAALVRGATIGGGP